jgi:hypothetical protein
MGLPTIVKMLRLLMQRGVADPNVVYDLDYAPSLHMAIRGYNLFVARLMIESGTDLNLVGKLVK